MTGLVTKAEALGSGVASAWVYLPAHGVGVGVGVGGGPDCARFISRRYPIGSR